MKHRIYGRKVGSCDDVAPMLSGTGAVAVGPGDDPGELDAFAVTCARRAVQALREHGVEGYVMFEGDPRPYPFAPEADFVYPDVRH